MHLNEKNIVLIGSGAGIGVSIADELLRSGARIMCVGRSLSNNLSKLLSENPNSSCFHPLDLTEQPNVDFLSHKITEKYETLDGIVFNIGGVVKQSPDLMAAQAG